jgi:murein L,D-transpeptidase YcbB/YkuD
MSDPRVPALRARLQITDSRGERDLAGPCRLAVQPMAAGNPRELLRRELEAAVKRFQERHGLTADGAWAREHARR